MSFNKKLLAALAAGSILVAGVAIAGDNDRSTSDVLSPDVIVPYDGYLAIDNTPMNGQRNMRFRLYDDPSAGTSVWSEVQSGVNFYNGRFSVGLGSVTPVTDVVLDAEKVYLGIEISDGAGSWVQLSGRQEITPAPYAAWSANASDFAVAGDLTVDGATQFNGPVTTGGALTTNGALTANAGFTSNGNLNANGRLQVTEPTNDAVGLRLNMQSIWDFSVGNNNLVVRNADSGNFAVWTDGQLRLNNASGSNVFQVDAASGGNTTIGGNLTVTGDITNFNVPNAFSVTQTGAGSQSVTMTSRSNSVCFLNRTSYTDVDGPGETATCNIFPSSSNWAMQANVSTGDAEARCTARCLTW